MEAECGLTERSTRTRCGKGPHGAVGNRAPCGPLPQRAGHLCVRPRRALQMQHSGTLRLEPARCGLSAGLGLGVCERSAIPGASPQKVPGSRASEFQSSCPRCTLRRPKPSVREASVPSETSPQKVAGMIVGEFDRRCQRCVLWKPAKLVRGPLWPLRRLHPFNGCVHPSSGVAAAEVRPNRSVETDTHRQGAASRAREHTSRGALPVRAAHLRR